MNDPAFYKSTIYASQIRTCCPVVAKFMIDGLIRCPNVPNRCLQVVRSVVEEYSVLSLFVEVVGM